MAGDIGVGKLGKLKFGVLAYSAPMAVVLTPLMLIFGGGGATLAFRRFGGAVAPVLCAMASSSEYRSRSQLPKGPDARLFGVSAVGVMALVIFVSLAVVARFTPKASLREPARSHASLLSR